MNRLWIKNYLGRHFFAVILFAFTCALGLVAQADALDEQPAPPTRRSERVSGELIVRFKPATSDEKKAIALKKAKGIARDLVPASARIARAAGKAAPASEQLKVVKVDGNVAAAQAALEQDPNILYVEPNYKTRIEAPVIPNDFEFDALYGILNTGANGGKAGSDIKAPDAWSIGTGSRDIIVAVVDTGIDYFHEDLRANIWTNTREIPGNGIDDDGNGFVDDVYGYDFVSNDNSPFDDHFHGTHVAGIVGASGNNGLGVVGVCWQVRLMAVKTFDEQGSGDVVGAIAGIHYAIANGARVINASWSASDRSRALADAIAQARDAGVIFVAAAGNSHSGTPFYPAGYDSVIAVASVNNRDEISPFSNYGPHVDISAPGEQILSTVPDGRYDAISGTSMSTPYVAGAAALILSRHPEFTPAQVATILKNTADPIKSERPIGRGRLNVFNALQIDVPLPYATLKTATTLKGIVKFEGTAAGDRFQRYTLSYGAGAQPTSWTNFFNSQASVTDGTLCSGFDTSILNDGTYTFRLEVFNDNGQSASDVATVQILNVQLAFPLSADIVRSGEPLALRGTVFGQGRRFGLEWSRGLVQNQWFNTGFTIPANGEVLDGTLGVFDTSLVASNEFYSFRLSATNSNGEVQQFYANYVWLDSHLRAGWPVYLPYDGDYALEDWRQAKVADLDGDGHKEVVIVDHGNAEGKNARLLVYRDNGTLWWSKELNHEEPYTDVPTIADLDGDGKLDILVDVGPTFYAFNYLGETLPGVWPVALNARRLGKVVADLDGDGKMEIIALANTPAENTDLSSLAIYDREGHVLQRWNITACNATNISQRSFPAVANMDSDPELEIVAVSACNEVMLFDTTRPDGPVWTAFINGSALNAPIIADLDRDGANDIVVATWSTTKGDSGVYRIDRLGRIAPGWPVLTEESFLTPPAVGDLDGDGKLEICVAADRTYKLHVLEEDGFEAPGWPVGIGNVSSSGSPGIADIDGDSRPDVVYAAPGYMNLVLADNDAGRLGGVVAWTAQGAQISLNGNNKYLPMIMEGSSAAGFFKASPVTITDIDGNGKMDVVAVSIRDRTFVPPGQTASFKNRSSIYVWELDAPAKQNFPAWTEFQHGPDNNSYIPTPKPPPAPPAILPIPNQTVAIGQPFAPIPLDEFLIFAGERYPGLTWSVSGQVELSVEIDALNVAHVTPPTPTWQSSETLTFTVTDGGAFTRSMQVVFTAKPNFFPPIATADEITIAEDSSAAIDVLANDQNPIVGALHVVAVSNPAHGKATLDDSGILYSAGTNYFGDDTFSYVVANDAGAQAFGTVTIHITAIDDAPLANDDRALTFEDRPVTIDVLANDKDVDGDVLTLVSVSAPTDGTAVIAQNKVIYQPKPGFNGTNVFSYLVTDGHGSPQQANITVIVRPLNNAPVAKGQSVVMNRNTSLDIFYLADDLENDPVTFRIIRGPAHGELFSYPTVGGYSPHKGYFGKDSFTYKASDGFLESGEATVDITILNTNNPPSSPLRNLMTRVNQAVSFTLTAIDLDDDPITFTILTQPANGILQGVGSNYVYTPNLNFLGKDEFTYSISDGMSETTGKVSIETTDKNTAPGANVKFVKTEPNTPVTIVLSGSDSESNPLTFDITAPPKHGVLSGDAPYVTYMPDTNYIGPDRLRFTVSDGEFTSDPAPVTIAIAPKNALPVATNQTVTIPIGGPGLVQLNVGDPDGDPIEIVILKGPRVGRLFGSGTVFTYLPNTSYAADVFTYKPWDGRNFGAEAQVRIEQVVVAPAPPGFESVKLTTAGEFQLGMTNQLGKAFRIEASADFKGWTVLTNVSSSSGRFFFNAPVTNSHIYYRAVQ